MVNRASATNLAVLYNQTFGTFHRDSQQVHEWPCSYDLSPEKIQHVFQLSALLRDWSEQGLCLELPHSDVTQDERLKVAIDERNRRIKTLGDPTAVYHTCDLCCVIVHGKGYKDQGSL